MAPMMGYTDCYFRSLSHNLFPNEFETISEMIVDKALIYNEKKTISQHFLPSNKSAIQIAGSEPTEIRQAVKILNEIEIINHVNFNLGCPSSRVQENNLGLALTQNFKLVKQCLEELVKYKKKISVKCRLGLGLEEDKQYIFDYLDLFDEIGIKTVFIHCRNGILNLDTKKNRSIPKINYDLFLECKKFNPKLNLIPNGEINEKRVFDYFLQYDVKNFMIGRQFTKDLLFLEKIGLIKKNNINAAIQNFLDEIKIHKNLNINLIKKSLFTILSHVPHSKIYKRELEQLQTLAEISQYFESRSIWN